MDPHAFLSLCALRICESWRLDISEDPAFSIKEVCYKFRSFSRVSLVLDRLTTSALLLGSTDAKFG